MYLENGIIHYETDHEIKYENLCRKHGVLWRKTSPRLINETFESLLKKYKEDSSLNNVGLKLWDSIAMSMLCSSSVPLYERVCMQKHAAIKMLLENM